MTLNDQNIVIEISEEKLKKNYILHVVVMLLILHKVELIVASHWGYGGEMMVGLNYGKCRIDCVKNTANAAIKWEY